MCKYLLRPPSRAQAPSVDTQSALQPNVVTRNNEVHTQPLSHKEEKDERIAA